MYIQNIILESAGGFDTSCAAKVACEDTYNISKRARRYVPLSFNTIPAFTCELSLKSIQNTTQFIQLPVEVGQPLTSRNYSNTLHIYFSAHKM